MASPWNGPASVSTRLAAGSIERTVAWTNCTPGLTISRVPVLDPGSCGSSEHHIQLREAEHERIVLIDQHDLDLVTKLRRKPGGQLQTAKAGTEHQDAHGPTTSAGSDQAPARVNVTCVTPLGEEVASTS